MKRIKVLLLADVCNPDWPSLPIVGYKYAKALANHCDVTVVTQIRNKPNIERDGLGAAKVVYLDTENIARPIYWLAKILRGDSNKGWTIQMAMDYPTYLAFEWKAWKQYKSALKAGEFDVVHRITPMSPTIPSYIAKRCPVPFLLGPLNGNLPWPKAFTEELKREKEWLSYFRSAYKLLPYYRSTYSKSRAILAAFSHTMKELSAKLLEKTINFPEVGIDPEIFSLPQRKPRDKVTVLYAGRLVPYKLPELVVRAFAASPQLRQHKLVMAGDGPDRSRIEKIIRDEGLEQCVELLGQVPQKVVGDLMRDAEVFAFPSIRELGAGVVVEAMACGMACVVVDYGAPGTLVGNDRGVKVPLGNFDQLVTSYVAELEKLTANPAGTIALGEAAHRHAMAYYPWDVKAKKTLEVYQWLLDPQLPKPDFWQST